MDDPQRSNIPLIDRYRALLTELDAQTVASRVAKIERALWQGSPGSPALLSAELREVSERGRHLRAKDGQLSPDLLILCVGYSPEPLLLAVAHHSPAEVLLLKETSLQGDYLQTLEELWNRHRPGNLPEFRDLGFRVVRDSAADLFLAVRDAVQARQPGGRIVLDITGAKKSMIAGAFLAAGFLELETSYVDFGEYDPVLRRPVPGTSRPGRLSHPYRLFKLREESQLQEELDRGNFPEAERLASTLLDMARSPEVSELLAPGEADARSARFEVVGQAARAYRRWREGFYAEAAEMLERSAAGIPVPATVERLSSAWPRSTDPHNEIVETLMPVRVFADPSLALAYFLDVLVWNSPERIGEHPRESFLRIYGTVESVIFFAFHMLVTRRPERLLIETAEPDRFQEVKSRYPKSSKGEELDWERLLRGVAIQGGEDSSRLALKLLEGKTYRTGTKIMAPKGWKGWPSAGLESLPDCSIRLPEPALPGDLLSRLFTSSGNETVHLGTFTTLRNKAVHWLAPVPEEIAQKLLQYYRTVLKAMIPQVVDALRDDQLDEEGFRRLTEWASRLLATADARIPEDCRPLTYSEILARVTVL